nr:twin-arginine translocation signal domain-containing protein [Gemmatimonadales bacterium]
MFGNGNPGDEELRFLERLSQVSIRRTFLKWSGVTIAAVATGCNSDDRLQPTGQSPLGTGLNGAPV